MSPDRRAAYDPDTASSLRAEWVVVVPVKHAGRGKTRLVGTSSPNRELLARAIALDTIAAAARVARVIVVTDDDTIGREAGGLGATAISEGDARGLNEAIAVGVRAGDATGSANRAALLGDLPALRASDLAAALDAASRVERGVVADAEGTGSTLVTARRGVSWHSAFGPQSFARHLALGCTALEIAEDSSLRRDVDTVAQLEAARALGLGPRTAALLG